MENFQLRISYLFTIFLIIGLTFTSCTTEDDCCMELPDQRVLVFGTYFGFCFGGCNDVYKIENGELFSHTEVDRINFLEPLTFEMVPESENSFLLAKPLIENFPDALLQEENNVIGIPDAYDQGGIYIKLIVGETSNQWFLDSNVEALPEYLRSYASQIKLITEQITD